MIEVEPALSVALEKDFWCTQNDKDVSLVIGSSLVCTQISVSVLQPLIYFHSIIRKDWKEYFRLS